MNISRGTYVRLKRRARTLGRVQAELLCARGNTRNTDREPNNDCSPLGQRRFASLILGDGRGHAVVVTSAEKTAVVTMQIGERPRLPRSMKNRTNGLQKKLSIN